MAEPAPKPTAKPASTAAQPVQPKSPTKPAPSLGEQKDNADSMIKFELIKLVMQKLLAMMEAEWPTSASEPKGGLKSKDKAKKPVNKADEDDVAKQSNVIDYLISVVHREFTNAADYMYGDGAYTQEDRIALSHAIGLALDAFNATVDISVPHLRSKQRVDPFYKSDETDINLDVVEFTKSDDEERLSYGVVYPAKPPEWKDTQNDTIKKPEIRHMAHDWLAKSQNYDMHHRELNISKQDAVVVESYIAPADFIINGKTITEGSWVVVTHYPSEATWARVKRGEFKAYSIRGKAKRTKIA